MSWFKIEEIICNGSYLIWNRFVQKFHWIRIWEAWDIGNGKHVQTSIDSFIGDKGNYLLPLCIGEHIINTNMTTLNQIKRP